MPPKSHGQTKREDDEQEQERLPRATGSPTTAGDSDDGPAGGAASPGSTSTRGSAARRAAARWRNTTTNPADNAASTMDGRSRRISSSLVIAARRSRGVEDGRRYSGTCDRTMIRGSVISSIANRRPSRPNPESFDPPYGIWSARNAETSFTITPADLDRRGAPGTRG